MSDGVADGRYLGRAGRDEKAPDLLRLCVMRAAELAAGDHGGHLHGLAHVDDVWNQLRKAHADQTHDGRARR